MHNRVEWHEVFFALARLGGVIVAANHPAHPAREIHHIVTDSAASCLVAEERLSARAEGLRELLTTDVRFVCVGALWSSGTVVLHGTDRPFDPQRFCELWRATA